MATKYVRSLSHILPLTLLLRSVGKKNLSYVYNTTIMLY